MRLERVTRELQSTPTDLALHDDAAVACDRLGRPDEAIAWMAKKKAVLDTLSEEEAKIHRYRYLANLGTFHVHRWASQPQEKREADLTDLREGERLIAQAIEENPDAHFGREIYQLMAIRWLLWDGESSIPAPPDTIFTHDPIHWVEARHLPEFDGDQNQAHIHGITGLIQLGAAWGSPDAFRSLAWVVDSGPLARLAELAYLREAELVRAGAKTIHPIPRIREAILRTQPHHLNGREIYRAYFPIARAAANGRNAAWISYQNERFAKNMHPDTHPDFWKAWEEPAFPEPPARQ